MSKTKRLILLTRIILIIISALLILINLSAKPLLLVLLLLIHIILLLLHLVGFNENEVQNSYDHTFITNLSHEIRTPLNGIMGMNNMLINSELKPEEIEYAKTIRSCSESLLTTINDLQDFTKIQSDDLKIECIQFDLRKVLHDFYKMNYLSAELKNLVFNYEIDGEVANYFRGDPGRIRQILSNLYNNAVKFTEQGRVDLNCTIISSDENQSILKFSMRDTGIGIEKRRQSEIFKNFYQLDRTLSRKYAGAGLGLSISSKLVRLMDGEMGVNSRVGIGSEFWFTIRLEKGVSLLNPILKADIKEINPLIISRGSIKQSKIPQIFSQQNIKHTLTETFKDALSKLTREKFCIIIFDLRVSQYEDITIEDFIGYIKEHSDAKLLTITSDGQRGDGELCRRLDIDAYLVEPLPGETLMEIISITLAKSDKNLITIHTLIENKRSRVKILVVDDNNVNLIIAGKLLQKMGFHSIKATGGKVALEILKDVQDIHLIFMDLQMPDMNGLQTTDLIRNEEVGFHYKDIPIIALTANYTAKDRENCSKVGMNEFLTKPYNPQLIENVINQYIKWDEL